MKKVTIGMIGGGFAAGLHGNALKQVGGMEFCLKGVADLNLERAKDTAERYGYETYTTDYRELLRDESIDVLIVCTPPVTHEKIILDVLQAGKHVICEKPLTGYFGEEQDEAPIGKTVDREYMFQRVTESLERIRKASEEAGKRVFYAENFIYAPSVQKAAEIIRKQKSTITFLQGECSVGRSPSLNAGQWSSMGGGSLLRIGCHPLAAVLYLKQVEAKAKGVTIGVKSVTCESGQIASKLSPEERKHVVGNPVDVEDMATVTITFTDDTKALVFSNDNVMGGLINYVNVYTTESTLRCSTVPTTVMQSYFVSNDNLDDIYISENLQCKQGWNNVYVSESIERGYVSQLKDFMECVVSGREPIVTFDIAAETIRTIYGAYISSSKGERVFL
ncbi:Gfo/Idh/MocA family protein [Hominifimenecus sp. rT4P-3]|uniref:Gfo/Idh/MocA family protein n=1 Tax=Hominifimenecus sp. rT4P-3 TaxID=3242979 RepID=UPI003DA5F2ED